MTWQCRHLLSDHCMLRNMPCVPGAKGCVLRGRYEFPLQEPEKPGKPEPGKDEAKG